MVGLGGSEAGLWGFPFEAVVDLVPCDYFKQSILI